MNQGKYVKKDEFGNPGGISAYWRSYTQLPSGLKLVEVGLQPDRPPDEERRWHSSPFTYGGITTRVWLLTSEELMGSIEAAFKSSLVYVGPENIQAAIEELATLGFSACTNGWEDKGYITAVV